MQQAPATPPLCPASPPTALSICFTFPTCTLLYKYTNLIHTYTYIYTYTLPIWLYVLAQDLVLPHPHESQAPILIPLQLGKVAHYAFDAVLGSSNIQHFCNFLADRPQSPPFSRACDAPPGSRRCLRSPCIPHETSACTATPPRPPSTCCRPKLALYRTSRGFRTPKRRTDNAHHPNPRSYTHRHTYSYIHVDFHTPHTTPHTSPHASPDERAQHKLTLTQSQCKAGAVQRHTERAEVAGQLPVGGRDSHGPERCVFREQQLL